MEVTTAAAIIAGLKYVDQPAADTLVKTIRAILTPSAHAAGEDIAAPLRTWAERRGKLATATIVDAATRLVTAGVEPRSVTGRLLMPILEKASVEEDDDLRRKWSQLLANAAHPITAHTILVSFPHILSELTPLEMKMLDFVFTHGGEKSGYHAFKLPDVSAYFQINRADTLILRTNLERLGLIAAPTVLIASDNKAGESYEGPLYLTPLGYAFIQACS